jgi:pantoate--beta-alanine ligase
MEGEFRPGHFQGVAIIVNKLFNIIKPDNAYFGQKDFQQLAIIKQLVKITNSSVHIISCPIIREENGLAMSSRNKRLSDEEFKQASIIYSTIKQLESFINVNKLNEFKIWVAKQINSNNIFKLEYIEIVDSETLKIVENLKNHKSITCCIAVFCGQVRLIDNIQINL